MDELKTIPNQDEYEYSEGINFKTDQPEHLTAIDKFTQKNGVGGAHTIESFNQAVKDYNLRIVSKTEHPTVKGIYQIEYEIPLKNKKLEYTGDYKSVEPKTVYDPNIISDEKILEWGQQAANNGLENAIINNRSAFNSTVNGVEFRVYVDLKTKTIRNFHPKL